MAFRTARSNSRWFRFEIEFNRSPIILIFELLKKELEKIYLNSDLLEYAMNFLESVLEFSRKGLNFKITRQMFRVFYKMQQVF